MEEGDSLQERIKEWQMQFPFIKPNKFELYVSDWSTETGAGNRKQRKRKICINIWVMYSKYI